MRTALVGGRTQREMNPAYKESGLKGASLPWTQLAVKPSRPDS